MASGATGPSRAPRILVLSVTVARRNKRTRRTGLPNRQWQRSRRQLYGRRTCSSVAHARPTCPRLPARQTSLLPPSSRALDAARIYQGMLSTHVHVTPMVRHVCEGGMKKDGKSPLAARSRFNGRPACPRRRGFSLMPCEGWWASVSRR